MEYFPKEHKDQTTFTQSIILKINKIRHYANGKDSENKECPIIKYLHKNEINEKNDSGVNLLKFTNLFI